MALGCPKAGPRGGCRHCPSLVRRVVGNGSQRAPASHTASKTALLHSRHQPLRRRQSCRWQLPLLRQHPPQRCPCTGLGRRLSLTVIIAAPRHRCTPLRDRLLRRFDLPSRYRRPSSKQFRRRRLCRRLPRRLPRRGLRGWRPCATQRWSGPCACIGARSASVRGTCSSRAPTLRHGMLASSDTACVKGGTAARRPFSAPSIVTPKPHVDLCGRTRLAFACSPIYERPPPHPFANRHLVPTSLGLCDC